MSCAELVAAGRQSLFINEYIASMASHLASELVFKRSLSTMSVQLSLVPISAMTMPITESTLRACEDGERLTITKETAEEILAKKDAAT